MKEKCISCGIRGVEVKKWRRCSPCYQRYRKSDIFGRQKLSTYQTEMDFVKNFFTHKKWMYHPAIFRFNGEKYEPDFYDEERDVFIEVAGTRQAFHANLKKYKTFVEMFPKINFEIRQVNGDLIDLNAEKYHINNNSEK